MNHEAIKAYALSMGFEFSDDDCEELIATSHPGETVQEAVNDYLDAYER